MKILRIPNRVLLSTDIDYKEVVFTSDLFSVTFYRELDASITVVESIPHRHASDYLIIVFQGRHKLYSDALCLEQLTTDEILSLIKYHGQQGFTSAVESCQGLLNDFRSKIG